MGAAQHSPCGHTVAIRTQACRPQTTKLGHLPGARGHCPNTAEQKENEATGLWSLDPRGQASTDPMASREPDLEARSLPLAASRSRPSRRAAEVYSHPGFVYLGPRRPGTIRKSRLGREQLPGASGSLRCGSRWGPGPAPPRGARLPLESPRAITAGGKAARPRAGGQLRPLPLPAHPATCLPQSPPAPGREAAGGEQGSQIFDCIAARRDEKLPS